MYSSISVQCLGCCLEHGGSHQEVEILTACIAFI